MKHSQKCNCGVDINDVCVSNIFKVGQFNILGINYVTSTSDLELQEYTYITLTFYNYICNYIIYFGAVLIIWCLFQHFRFINMVETY